MLLNWIFLFNNELAINVRQFAFRFGRLGKKGKELVRNKRSREEKGALTRRGGYGEVSRPVNDAVADEGSG